MVKHFLPYKSSDLEAMVFVFWCSQCLRTKNGVVLLSRQRHDNKEYFSTIVIVRLKIGLALYSDKEILEQFLNKQKSLYQWLQRIVQL